MRTSRPATAASTPPSRWRDLVALGTRPQHHAREDRAGSRRAGVGTYPETNGDNCEPCYTNFGTTYHCGEPWCAYFASWVWRTAGVWGINFGGTDQFYYWGTPRGPLRDFAHMQPGDVILYGTSPTDSYHIGVIETVWPDGTSGRDQRRGRGGDHGDRRARRRGAWLVRHRPSAGERRMPARDAAFLRVFHAARATGGRRTARKAGWSRCSRLRSGPPR
jgi:hypothetical protein